VRTDARGRDEAAAVATCMSDPRRLARHGGHHPLLTSEWAPPPKMVRSRADDELGCPSLRCHEALGEPF